MITARWRPGQLTLQVDDDGIGGARPAAGGTGLRGLTDRIEALGGTLTITSPPGQGTTLRAELPCE
jgi:signal transduction histidine kinase